MKNFLKIFTIIVCLVIVSAEIIFCIIIPRTIKLDSYKEELQKIVTEQTRMSLEYKSAQITTTPMFSAGIQAEDIYIYLPDGSLLFSTDSAKVRISLPSLLLFTLKVSCLEIEKPFLNLEIAKDNSNFKLVKLIENIINENKRAELETPKTETQKQDELAFDFSKIRIKVPDIHINNYKILINDLHSSHTLDLKGDKLQLGYNNGKTAKLKTFAQLHSDNNVNINANIDLITFLPKFEPSLDEEDDKAQYVKLPFVNPVEMYRNYDLKANLYTKLRINQNKKGEIYSFGYFDLENITMKISSIKLPESYIKAKMFNKNIWIDTNIATAHKQNLLLNGNVGYGKNPYLNLHINTDKIYFNDLIILSKAFLDSLHIQNELNKVTASGYLESDAYIKTNFKKLRSDGFFKVHDGLLNIRNFGNIISDAKINLLLNNNILNIEDSQLFINNAKITFLGNIDKKSVANIAIKTEHIALNKLFGAFAPQNLRNIYNLNNGLLKFDYSIKGKLSKAIHSANFEISKINFSDRSKSFILTNDSLQGIYNANNKETKINLINNNLSLFLPQTKSNITLDKIETTIDNNNISIAENKIYFNDNSTIKYNGDILDYANKCVINIEADGLLNSSDLIKFLGKEFSPYFNYRGNLPVKIAMNGNSKKQSLFARILADKTNYITPINFMNIIDKDTALQTKIDFKPNRIKIKKTGLYTITTTTDEEGNTSEKLHDIVSLDGTIAKDTINLLKIEIPNDLKANLHIFPKSSFTINKTKSIVFGQTSAPFVWGNIDIKDISIPELLTNIENIKLAMRGHPAEFDINRITLNGSDLNIKGKTNILPEKEFKIFDLDINSEGFDADKALVVAEKSTKLLPQGNTTTATSTNSNIPIIINNGNVRINKLKTGNINISDIYSDIILRKNILHLNNLTSRIFDGVIGGKISYDLISSLIKIDLSGAGINIEKALLDSTGMKDTLSGEATFKANLSLSGNTYEEQIKNLKGDIQFNATNGQFGPFGKIENLIIAENIRESEFFNTALGGVINSLTTIDTTHYSELKGNLLFNDGVCHIDELTSQGKILALHLFGNFDLLKNSADMKVRAKMASIISDLLGPIALVNPVKLLNSAASMNVVTAKAFSLFCETLTDEEMTTIPNLSNKYKDDAAMKFQLVVNGDVSKPLTLVKSFKWLSTALEFQKADEFIASIPEIPEGSTATTIEELIKEQEALEAQKRTLKYKIKNLFCRKQH